MPFDGLGGRRHRTAEDERVATDLLGSLVAGAKRSAPAERSDVGSRSTECAPGALRRFVGVPQSRPVEADRPACHQRLDGRQCHSCRLDGQIELASAPSRLPSIASRNTTNSALCPLSAGLYLRVPVVVALRSVIAR